MRGEPQPRDLDVGVLTEHDHRLDVVAATVELTGTQQLDLVHLNRGGPLIRGRALVGSIPLYEREPDAQAQPRAAGRMTPRQLGWRAVAPKLRTIDELHAAQCPPPA